MAVLRLFAAAREAAGTARDEIAGETVGDVLAAARARYGDAFAAVLATSRVWRNGEPAAADDAVTDADEVAVLPPVSGGAVEERDGGGAGRPAPDRSADRELGGRAASDRIPESAAADRTADWAASDRIPAPAAADRNPNRAASEGNPARAGDRDPARAVDRNPARAAPDRNPLPGDPRNPDRPHVRLGLLWAFATTVAAVLGAFVLAVWLAVVAALAAAQVARSWRRQPQHAEPAAAAAGAAIITLAAAVGPLGLIAGAVIASAVAFLRAAPPVTPRRTLLAAGPIGLACAAPVVLRAEGFPHAYALFALVWAYDAGCYVVGTGAANRWEGPAAGVATVAAVGLAVAVVFVPPFEGAWPWAFAAVVAALAPFAERAGSMLLGDRDAAVPVLRRIDSLLAAGPAFAALGLVVL